MEPGRPGLCHRTRIHGGRRVRATSTLHACVKLEDGDAGAVRPAWSDAHRVVANLQKCEKVGAHTSRIPSAVGSVAHNSLHAASKLMHLFRNRYPPALSAHSEFLSP